MTFELKMPALSPTMEEGTLARWIIGEGDLVRAGDVLAEVETDKATMEIEAVDGGRVLELIVAEGAESVAVGSVIALFEAVEDTPAASSPTARVETPAPPSLLAEQASVAVDSPRGFDAAADEGPALRSLPPPGHEGRDISPLADRLAQAKGIDLAGIVGSGTRGRIVKADLGLEAVPAEALPPPTPAPLPQAQALSRDVPDIPHEVAKLSNMRKTIARRLAESKRDIPHIYLSVDIRIDALLELRQELNHSMAAHGVKLSVNDLIIKAQALALKAEPSCNVQFAGDHLIRFERSDISVAVSIPNGLVTPVIRAADIKPVSMISAEMRALAIRAREGKLQPDDYTGGGASLSNLGMYGIRQFAAVINPPQAMILAIGMGESRPIIAQGAVEVARMLTATGSFDHRAIDGADAARWLGAFRELLESPLLILV